MNSIFTKIVLFGAVVSALDCFETPSSAECSTFEMPLTKAKQDLKSLCDMMPGMPGCEISRICESSSSTSFTGTPLSAFASRAWCEPFSLLASVCAFDMPRMGGCKDYTALCQTGSVVAQCKNYPPLQALPTTKQSKELVTSVCSEMDMKGCEECRDGKHCDAFKIYISLCQQMPNMSQCKAFASMCSWNPQLGFCADDSSAPSTGDSRPPAMKMYFHFGYRDYVLFESFVPYNFITYFAACLGCFLLAIAYEYLLYLNAQMEKRFQKQLLARQSAPEQSVEDPLLSSRGQLPEPNEVRVYRGLMRTVTISGAYVLMLITMTFNVGLFLSVVVGLGVGSTIWGKQIFEARGSVEEHCC